MKECMAVRSMNAPSSSRTLGAGVSIAGASSSRTSAGKLSVEIERRRAFHPAEAASSSLHSAAGLRKM